MALFEAWVKVVLGAIHKGYNTITIDRKEEESGLLARDRAWRGFRIAKTTSHVVWVATG